MIMISLVNVYLLGSIGAFAVTAYNRYSLHDNYFAFALSYWADPMTNVILYNFCLALMVLFQKMIALIVFGQIKENEKTKIMEKLKIKSLELLFLAVILHDQFTFPVFALALGLVMFFVLHHLTVLRSQYLINTHNLYLNEHARLLGFYLIMLFVDFQILKHSWSWIVAQNNMSIVFSFYILQFFLLLLEPCVKFTIYLYERFTGYQFNELDAKLNLIGFAINLPRLLLLNILGFYIMNKLNFNFFFVIMMIELVVELLQLLKNFSKVRGLGKMMESLPKIDREQIERLKMDDTCMICFREIYEGVEVPSCNHIFHNDCLKQWIHKNTNHFCPKCKKPFDFPGRKGEPVLINREELREEDRLEEPREGEHGLEDVGWKQKIRNLIRKNPNWQQNRQPEEYHIHLEKELDMKDEARNQGEQPAMIHSRPLLTRIGGVAFGIPHQAVYHRRRQDFKRRQDVINHNKTISTFLDQTHYKRTLLISQN